MSTAPRRTPKPRPTALRHRNLPLLLLQAREGVLTHFRPLLNAHGLTEQQWRIVRALLTQGPLEPRQIGTLCRISSPSLAGVLARMDELGLVRRERSAQDQRRVLVSLTRKSRNLATAMAPAVEAVYSRIEDHIGADFVQRFYATLDELIGLLEELPSGDEDDAINGPERGTRRRSHRRAHRAVQVQRRGQR
jgi:homoprotocatechuate degradation regulator HpaR